MWWHAGAVAVARGLRQERNQPHEALLVLHHIGSCSSYVEPFKMALCRKQFKLLSFSILLSDLVSYEVLPLSGRLVWRKLLVSYVEIMYERIYLPSPSCPHFCKVCVYFPIPVYIWLWGGLAYNWVSQADFSWGKVLDPSAISLFSFSVVCVNAAIKKALFLHNVINFCSNNEQLGVFFLLNNLLFFKKNSPHDVVRPIFFTFTEGKYTCLDEINAPLLFIFTINLL